MCRADTGSYLDLVQWSETDFLLPVQQHSSIKKQVDMQPAKVKHTHTHTLYDHCQVQKVNFMLIGDRTIK